MSVTVKPFTGKSTTYPDANFMYELDGSYIIANGPKERHETNVIYAIVSSHMQCIIQNDEASKQVQYKDPIEATCDILFNPLLRQSVKEKQLKQLKQILANYNTTTKLWK